jgi:hypothetical protein
VLLHFDKRLTLDVGQGGVYVPSVGKAPAPIDKATREVDFERQVEVSEKCASFDCDSGQYEH